MLLSIAMAGRISIVLNLSVARLRRIEIQMQPDSEERGALFQAVRSGCFQIISNRDDRIILPGSRDPGFPKLTLRHSLCSQFSENNDFIVVNPVFLNLEDPLRIETFVEPLNHGATFDVVEQISIHALPSLDLLRRKRFFEQVSIHVFSFLIEMSVLLWRTYRYGSGWPNSCQRVTLSAKGRAYRITVTAVH